MALRAGVGTACLNCPVGCRLITKFQTFTEHTSEVLKLGDTSPMLEVYDVFVRK